MNAVFTVADRTQLPHALALGGSLRLHNPDFTFILGWVDPYPTPGLPNWVIVIDVKTVIEEPTWSRMQETYADFEITTACRPFFAQFILRHSPEYHTLIFLAPTVFVCHSLAPVLAAGSLFRLTPHRLRPLPAGLALDDKRILNIGMFHSNSWVLTSGAEANALLDWWSSRTFDRARFDLCQGMCLDQLWLNYLPIYHDRVDIIRHVGWHYGLHTVADLTLQHRDGRYYVNDKALLTVDFAGLESYHPVWSDHVELASKIPHLQNLRKSYRVALSKTSLPVPDVTARYGRKTKIKSGRSIRKNVVRQLKALIDRIETYDLTH